MKRLVYICLVLGLAAYFFPARISAEDIAYSTLLQGSLHLEQTGTNPSDQTINGNIDCHEEPIRLRPDRVLPMWPFYQSEILSTACVVDAAFGAINPTGYLQRQGTDMSGELRNTQKQRVLIIPSPNSSSLVYIAGNAYPTGSYINVVTGADTNITSSTIYTGEVEHRLTTRGQTVADKSGRLLPIVYDSISFSANGQWMIGDVPFVGMVRVNLNDGSVLPFGEPYNYNIGVNPNIQSAISNDGSMAAVSSSSFRRFKIYDLNSCATVPEQILGPVRCSSRDIAEYLRISLPNYTENISTVRFIDGKALQFKYKSNQTNTLQAYMLYTGEQPFGNIQYLALGDSFASGEGAYNYKGITDTPKNKCHVSLTSYPYLISSELSLNIHDSIACSGAVTRHVVDKAYVESKPQAKGYDNADYNSLIYDSLLPGYRTQLSFLDRYTPRFITMSIGGNDIGFSDIIKRCIGPGTCYGSYEERLGLLQNINSTFNTLVQTYTKIKESTDPRTKIYIIGYPSIATEHGNCGANVHLDEEEILFANQLTDYLDQTIHRAADAAGVVYVDVTDALNGHRLCEAKYSDIAVNGLTAGRDQINFLNFTGPIGNESYHPNAMGHRLLANTIMEATHNFTQEFSATTDKSPIPITSTLPILIVPHSADTYSALTSFTTLTQPLITKGLDTSIDTPNTFKPGTDVQYWLHSTPVLLGSSTANQAGVASATVRLSADIPAGYHVLHAIGINRIGQTIDMQQVVYTALSENDIDGDNIPNSAEQCLYDEPAGQDIDQDAIDDSCDGTIDDPPVLPPTTQTPDTHLPKEIRSWGSLPPPRAATGSPVQIPPIYTPDDNPTILSRVLSTTTDEPPMPTTTDISTTATIDQQGHTVAPYGGHAKHSLVLVGVALCATVGMIGLFYGRKRQRS